jgi:hypothetical protein
MQHFFFFCGVPFLHCCLNNLSVFYDALDIWTPLLTEDLEEICGTWKQEDLAPDPATIFGKHIIGCKQNARGDVLEAEKADSAAWTGREAVCAVRLVPLVSRVPKTSTAQRNVSTAAAAPPTLFFCFYGRLQAELLWVHISGDLPGWLFETQLVRDRL